MTKWRFYWRIFTLINMRRLKYEEAITAVKCLWWVDMVLLRRSFLTLGYWLLFRYHKTIKYCNNSLCVYLVHILVHWYSGINLPFYRVIVSVRSERYAFNFFLNLLVFFPYVDFFLLIYCFVTSSSRSNSGGFKNNL